MRKIYFTADTHFGHSNIIRYSNRPFVNSDEMDQVLIDNINSVVRKDDTLYHLGDWSFRDPRLYRQQINCDHIYLIFGNHDKRLRRNRQALEEFQWWGDFLEIEVEGQAITLCHYAMKVWNKSHHGAWHLYGHSHGSLPDDPNSMSFDIGVDCWGYRPLLFDEVKERMGHKTFLPIDHHGTREHESGNQQKRLETGNVSQRW